MAVVEYLIRTHQMDPNVASQDGRTAIVYATKCDKPELVQFLIKYGAEVDVETKMSMTPLLIATKMNSKIMVKVLFEKGKAKIDHAVPPRKLTALFVAVNNCNLDLVSYLCDREASIAHRLCNNTNVVMLACWKGYIEILKVLCSVLIRRKEEEVLKV